MLAWLNGDEYLIILPNNLPKLVARGLLKDQGLRSKVNLVVRKILL